MLDAGAINQSEAAGLQIALVGGDSSDLVAPPTSGPPPDVPFDIKSGPGTRIGSGGPEVRTGNVRGGLDAAVRGVGGGLGTGGGSGTGFGGLNVRTPGTGGGGATGAGGFASSINEALVDALTRLGKTSDQLDRIAILAEVTSLNDIAGLLSNQEINQLGRETRSSEFAQDLAETIREFDRNFGFSERQQQLDQGNQFQNRALQQLLGQEQIGLGQDRLSLDRLLGQAGIRLQGQQLNQGNDQFLANLLQQNQQFGANLGLQRQLGLGDLQLGQGQLDLSRLLGQGNLQLGQGQLDLSRLLGQGNLGLGQDRLALDQLLGVGGLELGQGQLGENARQFDANLALQQLLGQGGQDTTRRGQDIQQQLGLGQLGLGQGQLGENARQFDASFGLQELLGVGNLELNQAELAERQRSTEAGLAENARQFDLSNERLIQQHGETIALQRAQIAQQAADSAMRAALGQGQLQLGRDELNEVMRQFNITQPEDVRQFELRLGENQRQFNQSQEQERNLTLRAILSQQQNAAIANPFGAFALNLLGGDALGLPELPPLQPITGMPAGAGTQAVPPPAPPFGTPLQGPPQVANVPPPAPPLTGPVAGPVGQGFGGFVPPPQTINTPPTGGGFTPSPSGSKQVGPDEIARRQQFRASLQAGHR